MSPRLRLGKGIGGGGEKKGGKKKGLSDPNLSQLKADGHRDCPVAGTQAISANEIGIQILAPLMNSLEWSGVAGGKAGDGGGEFGRPLLSPVEASEAGYKAENNNWWYLESSFSVIFRH